LKSVIVIGGGLAGLAAGVALAEADWRVRLFEQRPFLGGRATSYVLPDGEHVDNCQHVTFGCCTNLEDFYRRVGAADKIKFFDGLVLLDPQGRRGEMSPGIFPAPFHMTGSFLTFSPLALKDKLCIARAFKDILFSGGHPADLDEPGGISMLEWLRRRKQTPAAISRFWRTVLVSALSEELDRIDARYGVQVFWKAVLSNRNGSRMGVPQVALADLYNGCRVAIVAKGGEVTLRSPLRKIAIEDGAVTSVGFDNDRHEQADAYVFALPHDTMDELLPNEARQLDPSLAGLQNIKDAPITGVHLWFDRQVMTEPFISLLDTTTQWIFNKSALHDSSNGTGTAMLAAGTASAANVQYLQLVISASHDLLQKPRQEIIDECLQEVRHALPAAREANLVKATVIKEAAATFSPEPGVDRWRPKQQTRIRNMFLAGDWTDTGWPATMEGAVRSGYLAAEAILKVAGTPRKFLQPDLKVDALVSLLARNSG
jgi:squalene-associated FAD-dependent desaturase